MRAAGQAGPKILFDRNVRVSTRYTAVAVHGNEDTRKKHEEMGFHEGWGQVFDQMVEYVQSLR